MKKFASILAIAFLILSCVAVKPGEPVSEEQEEPEVDLGKFSIETLDDTVKTDTVGSMVNYEFDVINHTDTDLTVIVDIPYELQEMPLLWGASICQDVNCFLPPYEATIPAGERLHGLHVALSPFGEEGEEGSVVLTVTAGEEMEQQTFICKLPE